MCHCSISSDMISHMNLGRQFSCLKIFHQPSIVRNCCVIGEGNPQNHQTIPYFFWVLWASDEPQSSQINETHCRFEFEVPTKSDHLLTNEYTKHQLDKNYMELHFLYESCCISTIDMKHVVATLKKTLSPYLPSKRDLVEKVVAETRGKKNGKKKHIFRLRTKKRQTWSFERLDILWPPSEGIICSVTNMGLRSHTCVQALSKCAIMV